MTAFLISELNLFSRGLNNEDAMNSLNLMLDVVTYKLCLNPIRKKTMEKLDVMRVNYNEKLGEMEVGTLKCLIGKK